MANGLRFGIICSDGVLEKWQATAIRSLIENGHKLILVVTGTRAGGRQNGYGSARVSRDQLLWSFCTRYFFRPPQKQKVDMRKEMESARHLDCLPIQMDSAECFSDEDVAMIRSEELDFILQFGFDTIGGEILNAAKYGVWSFLYGNEQLCSSGPAGFMEIYSNIPVSTVILQRLTEVTGKGIILRKAVTNTLLHSFQANLDVLLWVSASLPYFLANEISLQGFHFPPPVGISGTDCKMPGNVKVILFLLKLLRNRMNFYWHDLFRAEKWNIGIINHSIQELALNRYEIKPENILWMRERGSHHYYADPSGFMEENKVHILMEDYSLRENKAHISEAVFDPARKSFSIPLISIETKEHLSYPFIFTHGENIYCLPSSFRYNHIGLYKRNYSEGAFMADRVLIDKIDAIDPTLISFNDRWWLFFTLRQYSNTHLYVYSSDELYGGYKPHPKNPVKIDIRSSRPAGLPFIHQGQLFRPAKDCSGTYGRRIAINKVTALSEQDYQEEVVSYFGPLKNSRYTKGVHTIFGLGKYTLVDAKRYKFDLHHFGRNTGKKFQKR